MQFQIPILFSVPPLSDPMEACVDLGIEGKARRGTMLGLGDVILPGYLIAYCFYVDVMKRSRHYTYGLLSLFGYTVGMVATFVALYVMRVGQPALIYLVPCSLGPVIVLAAIRKELRRLWLGDFEDANRVVSAVDDGREAATEENGATATTGGSRAVGEEV